MIIDVFSETLNIETEKSMNNTYNELNRVINLNGVFLILGLEFKLYVFSMAINICKILLCRKQYFPFLQSDRIVDVNLN